MTGQHRSTRTKVSAPRRAETGKAPWPAARAADIAARSVAAIVGGYALSALVTALLAGTLPTTRIEAAIAPATFSFVLYVTLVCWAFAVRRTWLFSAVLGILVLALAAMLGWMTGGTAYP